jgi:nucleotide-binding universal stress UspA family protein
MTSEQKVLVFGDDGSVGADVAWLWVNNHVWSGWELDVVHVVPPPPGAPPSPEQGELHEAEPDEPRVYLPGGVKVRHLTARADPRAILGGLTDASVMVIGARGKGLFKALNLGSTADWLLQCPPAPLLIVRSARPVQQILVCVDGSRHAWHAVEVLAQMPFVAGANVAVLSVGPARQPLSADVDRAAELLAATGASVEIIDRSPDPLEPFYDVRNIILDTQAQLGTDLLVIGTRGLSAWQNLGVGSIANALARHSPSSVFLARIPEE